jgi:hypothetical protein
MYKFQSYGKQITYKPCDKCEMVDLAVILCALLKSYMEAHMVTLTYDYC